MIETNFKHTDIGPIPHDWEITPLNELFEFGNGYTPSTENPKFWSNRGLPWFKMEDIRKNGRILSDSILHITPEAVKSSGLFPAGSFIISTTATIGEHAWLIADSLANQRFTFLKKGKSLKDIDSWYFFFKLFEIGEWCRNNVSKSTLMSVNMTGLKSYLVSHPSDKKEQQRIGKALSDVDGLIEGLRKLIDKKSNIKQGAMSRLLSGSLRIPGFNKPWVTRTLGEIGHLIPNNSLSWEYMTNSGKVANIHYGHILTRFGAIVDVSYTQLPYVEKNSEARFHKGNMANDGDIIFADTAEDDTVGKAVELINIGSKHVVSGLHTFWFRPDVAFAHSFLGYAVNGETFHSQIPLLATGTKVSSISKPNLLKLELHYPTDLAEQSAIAKVLADMDAEIEGLEKKLTKYEQVKQGMMKQLLTGKIRLI